MLFGSKSHQKLLGRSDHRERGEKATYHSWVKREMHIKLSPENLINVPIFWTFNEMQIKAICDTAEYSVINLCNYTCFYNKLTSSTKTNTIQGKNIEKYAAPLEYTFPPCPMHSQWAIQHGKQAYTMALYTMLEPFWVSVKSLSLAGLAL